MIPKKGLDMIVSSYLDKLTVLVDTKGPDSGAYYNEIKEAYCFIKVLESPKTKTRFRQWCM